MFEAQLLITKTAKYEIYSPWFSRNADNMMATLEIVALDGTPRLKVQVWTKNTDDTGNGTQAGTGEISRTATGRETLAFEGNLDELVRYKFLIDDVESQAGNWVLFRMLAPSWYDDVV